MGGADEDAMTPRAFGGTGKKEPNYLLGFGASALSSIPELFGAQPWETAEAFRTANPWSGLASEMVGFAVPYLGAEAAVMKSPALAARLGGAVEGSLGRLGMVAEESPIMARVARESIINAPIEAARLASGALFYPENFGDQFTNVATDVALTGALGGVFGALSKGGGKREAREVIEDVGLFESPTYRLNAMREGKAVEHQDPTQLAADLEREVFTGNPGYSGVRGKDKPLDYVGDIPGVSPENKAGLNSIFKLEKGQPNPVQSGVSEGMEDFIGPLEPEPASGFSKQYFWENRTENGASKFLNPGERGEILAKLPEGLRTASDVAATFESPRLVRIHDEAGARAFAGLISMPGMQKVGKTFMIQEKDGPFVQIHKTNSGKGKKFGDGVKVQAGDEFLVGKTIFPGRIEPQAQGLTDLVTASWAKNMKAFQPSDNKHMYNQIYDDLNAALPDKDFRAARLIRNDTKRKNFIAEKLGAAKAGTKGLMDQKFNFGDSRSIQELSDSLSILLKPTNFLMKQNPHYDRLLILLKAGQDHAKRMTEQTMFGKEIIEGTSEQALRGKNVRYESGYKGHLPWKQMSEGATDADAALITHYANADIATPAAFEKAVKDGDLTPAGQALAERLRALNQDKLGDIIPVLNEAGHADVQWLDNHLGIPKMAQGDHFITVTDAETGDLKHTAFGRNPKEAELNADLAIQEAGAEGQNWTRSKSKLRELSSEDDATLKELQATLSRNLEKNPTDVKILTKAMNRLAIIKGTTGKGPSIPITSKALQKRKGGASTADIKQPTLDDLANAVHGHLSTLDRFAAQQSWRSRFGDTIPDLLKHEPKLAEDLANKERQYLGIASKATNLMDRKLSGVLGTTLGARPATKISAAVNEAMFGFTLGLVNPSHAILSLLSPLQTVAPHIMHMATLPIEDAARMMQFTPVIGFDGRPRGMSAWMEPIKVLQEAVKLTRHPPAELRAFHEQGLSDGIFRSQHIEEWSGGNSKARTTLTEAWKQGGLPRFIRKLSTVMAETSESLSRLVAFNAAWRIGKDFFGLEGDELYRFMVKSNETTMFNYGTVDRSNLFTGPVGSMFGLFKNWQMHFMGNMFQYADQAVNHGNFGPLVWAGGSAVALGGLGATPLIALADGLGNWENEANSSYMYMEKNFGSTLADPLYFGLPAFLGVSLQASSTLPGTDVRNETSSLFSFAIMQRATMLGKAVGKGWEYNEATGNNPLQDSNVRDMLVQATAPRAMIRALSVVEGDYVKSMSTGYPMMDGENVGYVGKMLHGLGMNSLDIAKAQEASTVLYRHEEEMKSAISGLGRGYYNAVSDGDTEEAQRILHRVIAMHVPLDSVMKSAMAIREREEGSDILSRYGSLGQYEARKANEMRYPQ
jgi:hypothetical protein